MADPYAVLGLPPDASPGLVRAARRSLVKALHPDGRVHDRPDVRAAAEHRLAEINAAYDELATRWQVPAPAGPPAAQPAWFSVGGFRPDVFEALVVAAADVGDVTDADEPFSLELHVEGPPAGFCRLELFPEAGATVVVAESDAVDAGGVCELLVSALQRLGIGAGRVPT